MVVRAVSTQVRGFFSNAWAYFSDLALDDVIPPSIVELVNWFLGMFPQAFGLRGATPREQINANIVLMIWWALWSIPSVGTTLVLVAFHAVFLVIGMYRWYPFINKAWRRMTARLPVADDYNIPFWRSE